MGIPIYDHLGEAEAKSLAEFLIEMIGMERAISASVVRFFAAPGREGQFQVAFLDRKMLGAKIEWLKPAIKNWTDYSAILDRIQSLTTARNAVAHSLPEPGWSDPTRDPSDEDWSPERDMIYTLKDGRWFTASDLHGYAVEASWVTARLQAGGEPAATS